MLNPFLTSVFEECMDCETGETFAKIYVARRAEDAAKLLSEMQWVKGNIDGTLQCRIYGHSILWDVTGVLHAGNHVGKYEVLFNGEDEPEAYLTLAQVVGAVLGKNW
jgi:hypothetical protein